MAPKEEKSNLKRGRVSEMPFHAGTTHTMQNSVPEQTSDLKKPRRSERLGHVNGGDKTHIGAASQLPSPVTNKNSSISDKSPPRAGTVTPPGGKPSHLQRTTPPPTPKFENGFKSPQNDTQAFSQAVHPPKEEIDYEVDDEDEEGVWGYLVPTDDRFGDVLVLKSRAACPVPKNTLNSDGDREHAEGELEEAEAKYEETKKDGLASSGYLIGRHPECGESRQSGSPD